MRIITTIGLDLAKKVFHVHGVDAEGNVVVARRLRRKEVLAFLSNLTACLVGIEACGSAHYWAREIARLGHTVKLIPPRYVKPYVKRGKTDPGDAAAICEAVASMRLAIAPPNIEPRCARLPDERLGDGVIAAAAAHDCNARARGTRRKASRVAEVLTA